MCGRMTAARAKKPKVQIKRQKVSLGWAYRIYIDGNYMGTGLTQACQQASGSGGYQLKSCDRNYGGNSQSHLDRRHDPQFRRVSCGM